MRLITLLTLVPCAVLSLVAQEPAEREVPFRMVLSQGCRPSEPRVPRIMPTTGDSLGGRSPEALSREHCFGAPSIDSLTPGGRAARTLSEALAGRVAGVSVLRSSGVTGTGSRVRIRGGSGLVIPREPLLVVDGVRIDNSQSSLGIDVGGQHPSRLDDLPLDDIQRIDVLRGPAATALYGTDAAGGVIAVTTRQGRAGPMHWHGYAESGLTSDATGYPANTATGPPTYGAETCTRAGAALGQCTPGPLARWNPLEQASPFRTGARWAGGASASGGTRTMRYFAGGTASTDQGVLAPNDARRHSGRVNVDVTPLPALRVALRASHLASGTTFPLGDVFSSSTLYSGLMGNTADDPVRRGYLGIDPASLATAVTKQHIARSFGSAAAEWTPLGWLTARGLMGREIVRRDDSRTFPMAVAYLDPAREGPFRIEGSTRRDKHTTLAGGMTADYVIAGTLRGSTTVGSERLTRSLRIRDSLIGFFEDGRQAEFGLRLSREPRKVVGFIAAQRLAWSGRILDVGVRRDGRDRWLLTRPTTYYSAAATWNVSDERFFYSNRAVSQLRLHGAYGMGGDSRPLRVALESAPVRPPPVGEPPPRPSFRPEKISEMELGAELWSLYGRVKTYATWYRQRSTNALERGCCLGPLGYDDGAGWRTDGVELTVASKLLHTLTTDWDAQLTFATVSNTYDRSRSGQPRTLDGSPFFGGARRRLVRGYPIAGVWGHPVTGRDANGDGVIVPSEATEATDSVYLGSSIPTREAGLATTLGLFRRRVTLSAQVDYHGGFMSLNETEAYRCAVQLCSALYDPGASVSDQTRAVLDFGEGPGFTERGDFLRLREVAVTWVLAPGWSRRHGAGELSLTATSRNLLTVTGYSGLDPEVNALGQSSFGTTEFFTLPLPRTFVLRLGARW